MTWNDDKLVALRQKYGADAAGAILDPRFKGVAERIFSASGTRQAPYAGVPTLLSAAHMPGGPDNAGFDQLQVALVGVPMDLGVTNRPGARFGPRALRTIERIGPYNHVLGCAPVFDLRVADIGDVPMSAATGSNNATRTSRRSSAVSSTGGWCPCPSGATIR